MLTATARQYQHAMIAQLAAMTDQHAHGIRHALHRACASDAIWRIGRDAAAQEFYTHADWLACGDLKLEGPAISRLVPQTAQEPEHAGKGRERFLDLSTVIIWLSGFGTGLLVAVCWMGRAA